MTILEEIQKLEPSAQIRLFELDASDIGGGVTFFHGYKHGIIIWQGIEYNPWPIEATGFARTSDQQPTPKLLVGNVDGSISQLCMLLDDLVGAKLIVHTTFKKFLDAANFDAGNPDADPGQEAPLDTWYIDRKAGETYETVEFDLSSALDFGGLRLPGRIIVADHCPPQWDYRGENCGYTGPPVADINDEPTSDPEVDRCGKRLSSCKLREWPDGVLNYGSFAAAGLVRT